MPLFYLSFARTRAEGGFLGATVIEGRDAKDAHANATLRGLNPGGFVAILEVPKHLEEESDFAAYRNRLVGREEVLARGGNRLGDIPKPMRDRFRAAAMIVPAVKAHQHRSTGGDPAMKNMIDRWLFNGVVIGFMIGVYSLVMWMIR